MANSIQLNCTICQRILYSTNWICLFMPIRPHTMSSRSTLHVAIMFISFDIKCWLTFLGENFIRRDNGTEFIRDIMDSGEKTQIERAHVLTLLPIVEKHRWTLGRTMIVRDWKQFGIKRYDLIFELEWIV